MFPLKPLECCFSSMLRVIVLLEGEPPSQSQITSRLTQLLCQNIPVYPFSIFPSTQTSFPVPAAGKTSPWWCSWGDGMCRFAPEMPFSLVAAKFNLSLFWPEHLPPYIWRVAHMPFGKLKTVLLLTMSNGFFSGHSSISVRFLVVLWTDAPVSVCRVTFGFCAASLINALLAWSVSFGGLPSLGRFVVVPCSFHS